MDKIVADFFSRGEGNSLLKVRNNKNSGMKIEIAHHLRGFSHKRSRQNGHEKPEQGRR